MTHRIVARNVMWNWAGMATNVLAGFVVAPFLVHRLGQTNYGLWILVASLFSYFGLLDMGVRGAVGRQIAFHRAKNDHAGLSATLNTSLVMMLGMGFLALLGTLGAMVVFFRIFDVPPDQVFAVRWSLLLVGMNLVFWLPLNLFDAMLWADQRFDLINIVDISSVAVRVALTFYLVCHGMGLLGLAIIHLLTLAGGQAIKGVIVFRIARPPQLGRRHVTKSAARAVLGISLWNMLLAISAVVNSQVGPMVIGSRLGIPLVTPFSIAARLIAYGADFLVAASGVLTPVAITLHAEQKRHQETSLFLEGSRYCLAVALLFAAHFIILGHFIIGLWMGKSLAYASHFLVILAIGEFLPMSQLVAYSMILGKYRHRFLAVFAAIENTCAIFLALLLVKPYGLVGVCVAFAIPGFLFRGVLRLVFACRLIGVPLWKYAAQVAGPTLLAAAIPIAGLVVLTHWRPPAGWADLIGYSAAFTLACALCFAPVLGVERLRKIASSLLPLPAAPIDEAVPSQII